MMSWFRRFIEAFRLARRIQCGELIAVRPEMIFSTPTIVPVSHRAEILPAPLPADAPPVGVSGRYLITVNGKVRWRGDGGPLSQWADALNTARPSAKLELVDTLTGAVRARRDAPVSV